MTSAIETRETREGEGVPATCPSREHCSVRLTTGTEQCASCKLLHHSTAVGDQVMNETFGSSSDLPTAA